MGRSALLLIAGIVLCLYGCYESEFPLGPAGSGSIDTRIPGIWKCVQGGDKENKPFLLTIMPFDGTQYYAGVETEGEKASHYRAFSSSIKETSLLNLQEIDANPALADRRWIFIRYTLLKPNILQIELVKDEAFKGIDRSLAAVRKNLEEKIASPALYQDFCVCTRGGDKK
jgi:hypothetical protein